MTRCLAILLLVMSVANAEESLDPRITPEVLEAFERKNFLVDGFRLPFRLLAPPARDANERLPLVLFLHGMGERGDENQRQLIHGGATFASHEFRSRYRAFVVAPQCPGGTVEGVPTADPDDAPGIEANRAWTAPLSPKLTRTLDLDEVPTPQLAAVRRLVDELIATEPIDPDRVYVVGLSMGGYATWELAAREPDFWAAAVPICGGGDPRHAERLATLPLWVFHGADDNTVWAQRSREMVDAIQAAGGLTIYTEYPGVGHDSWTPTLENRLMWDWLFAQRR